MGWAEALVWIVAIICASLTAMVYFAAAGGAFVKKEDKNS